VCVYLEREAIGHLLAGIYRRVLFCVFVCVYIRLCACVCACVCVCVCCVSHTQHTYAPTHTQYTHNTHTHSTGDRASTLLSGDGLCPPPPVSDLPSCIARWCLAFTRYCCYQHCIVYGMPKGGRGGVVYCPIAVQ